jgi:hypothetical protein
MSMYNMAMPTGDEEDRKLPPESPPYSPTSPCYSGVKLVEPLSVPPSPEGSPLFCEETIDDLIANMEGLKFQTAYGVLGAMGVKVNKQGQFTFMAPQSVLTSLTLMKSVHASFYTNYICLSTTSSKADALYSQNLAKMVYKAFHPEVALQDIFVIHKDNNAMNCALDNLIAKPLKAIRATERAIVAMHDFADLRNEMWVPLVLWDGTEIAHHLFLISEDSVSKLTTVTNKQGSY